MPSTKHWTTDPDGEVNIKTTLSGPASLPPITINECFKRTVQSFPENAAMCVKRGGVWAEISYQEYYLLVSRAAKSLIKLGLEPHNGACVIGFNSPEWSIAYLGSIMAGGVGVGVYSTNNKEACHYVAESCSANVYFCEEASQIQKILEIRDRLPKLKAIVQYLPVVEVTTEHKEAGVMSWEEFLAVGSDIPDYELSWRIEAQKPNTCASIIYTSGTTGPPKGVMLSHDNLTWTATVVSRTYNLTEKEHFLSYLPLSHIAAQMSDIIAGLVVGHTVWFAQPDALKGSLRETLLEVRPTLFLGMPRVWEKFKSAIEMELDKASGLKSFVLEKARNVGRRASLNRQHGGAMPWGHWLSDKLIFKSLREKLGLDRCEVLASGAAPLPKSVADFFSEFDMPLCQLYGMSESTGAQCYNSPERFKPGAAGRPLAGVEIKIDSPGPNGDGEICFRGRHVFMGYINQERKTKEAIDDDGWLHSGDIGSIDSEGFCHITGRSKELIITKGGENIAPVPIEEQILEASRILSHAMVVGDDQKYLTMFVTVKCELDDYGYPTDELDPIVYFVVRDLLGSKSSTVTEVVEDLLVVDYIQQCLDKVNKKAINRASRVQKFVIIPQDFTIAGGELTPTMKMKRPFILEKYRSHLSKMYLEES